MTAEPLRIDIVSDVVCPWCIVGFRQLSRALDNAPEGTAASVHWHPFELNPQMPPEGQDLREHIAEKYGSTEEQSQAVRDRLSALGQELDFTFNFPPDRRIHNTFQAHQLLHWAGELGRQTDLKLALFTAYFTDGQDVSDTGVLLDVAASIGLDRDEAQAVLDDGRYEEVIRQLEQFWTSRGIQGVPAVVFEGKYLISGAQDASVFSDVIAKCLEEQAAKGET